MRHFPSRLRALLMRSMKPADARNLGLVALLALIFAGCSGSSTSSSALSTQTRSITVYRICPGADAQKQALLAFFDAREGDVIEFCEGKFDFDTGLIMTGKRGITIRGAGREKTYLRFAGSPAQDGISINQADGIKVQNLTIYDAPGNGLRIFRTSYVTISNVRVGWSNADPASPYGNYDASRASWSKNGAYSFYPVVSRHILIEDSVSVGSADAGVYVGQSSDVLVRRTEAFNNVAGFEFENTYRAEFVDNVAHDNVGGFLIFDLPGRVQFGEKNLVHHNKSYNNNTASFAPRGAIVAVIPAGTGMLVAASDQLEVYDNEITGNKTVGFAVVNYGLVDGSEPSTNYDFYSEGIHIYNNTFKDNGYSPALPDLARSSCTGAPGLPAGFPGPGDSIDCLGNNATLLPLIIAAKNLGRSAHIVWDGGVDAPNSCDKIPVDSDGIALTQPNPNEKARPEARTDERGRPNLYQFDPIPQCKWNKWKFDTAGKLKKPANGLCVEGNTFTNTRPEGQLVSQFANVHFSSSDLTSPVNLAPADNTLPHDCPSNTPAVLTQYKPDLGNFTANPGAEPRPTEADINRVCGAVQPGRENMEAVLNYNCPRLDQFGLFANAEDPRKNPNGFGMNYTLNTALFTDYASKYRFLFLPPGPGGAVQKATYQDHAKCTTLNVFSCYTQTLQFPVGTVLSKTFTFKNGSSENIVETRLLIKRKTSAGVRWVGLPYVWKAGADGKRYAVLKIEGDLKSVSYNYDDPDPEAKNAAGTHLHYQGSTDKYTVPNAGACLLCHSGDDLESGAPPIGPKVRNLNLNNSYADVGTMNQLAYMRMKGYLDLPGEPDQLERLPRFNVPGSTGETANSPADIHKRVRAFMEVNCMHCHNPAGNAQNSGLHLDSYAEPMTEHNGICKPPIAAGKAADFGSYDIQPGNSTQSILPNRVASTEPGIRMPPLGRSLMQGEAVELINNWVANVVSSHADPKANKCGSSSGSLPLLPALP